jgi:hypothetical protein
MNIADSDICLEAFNALFEELSVSKLVSLEECQYWMFERGYKAALAELIDNIDIAAKSEGRVLLDKEYLVKKAA